MAEEFGRSVEDGLKLSKRIYLGKDRAVTPPKPPSHMDKSPAAFLPTAPMVYAVISDPGIVDNPDIPSYQPHVYGRCDPPALIPLQMNRIELEADSYLDTAFVKISGSWRVHCVMGSKSCDCRLAVPMGEQGSILGVEIEASRKLYYTEMIAIEDRKYLEKEARLENGGFLKPHTFTITIPKVDGGSTLSIKVSWMQKLLYHNGEFSLIVPFSFPDYVTPHVKKLPRKEKIQLNVNTGTGTEIVCKTTSHLLKELRREVGKLGFLYESEVLAWTNIHFTFSYAVSFSHIFGGVLLQTPSVHDVDQRDMFCVYLFPGGHHSRKVFRKEIVFVVDISGSMVGEPLEGTKNAISAALTNLDSLDSFNIIAFNGETYLFSSSMELASEDTVERAIEWMSMNFIAGGDTNILVPLKQGLADIIPKDTLLWKLKLLKSAAAYANSRLHSVKAEVLVLSSGKDQMLPSGDESQRLKSSLKNCTVRHFKENGHTVLLEDGVNLLTVIKGTSKYRRSRRLDYVSNYVPPSMSEFKRISAEVGLLQTASSAAMFSTLDNGKIVRGLGGVPNEGPVLLVGYHMLLGLELPSLVEAFLREKNIMIRGMTHPMAFSGRLENSSAEFQMTDWMKVMGAVPVTASNIYRLLSTNSHVLLYPGGAREAFHYKGEEYKLMWPKQQEFVRMAARFGATIVPFGAVGEDDIAELVLDYNDLMKIPVVNDYIRDAARKSIKIRDESQGEVANQMFYLPGLLPKVPGRFYYLFGKPIETKGKGEMLEDKENANQLYLQIKSEVESCLAYLLKKREDDPHRSIIDRTVYRALRSPADEVPAFDP